MASYARDWERFTSAGLQVVGIAVDAVANNKAMVEKLLLPFSILSDPEARVIKEWDLWNPHDGGVAKPSLFLVRPDMSLGYAYVGTDFADRPTDAELWEAVERG